MLVDMYSHEEQKYKNRKHEGCTYFVAWGEILTKTIELGFVKYNNISYNDLNDLTYALQLICILVYTLEK